MEIMFVRKYLLRASLPLAALLLSACVNPYRAPAPVSSVPPPSNGPDRSAPGYPQPQSQPQTQPDYEEPQVAPPAVVIAPGERRDSSASSAVDNLLDEGWHLYGQQRYDASISVAERGLRIDRHRAELYQLLSRNYLATLQLQQAEQLARQGLSIPSASGAQRAALEDLLREIEAIK
ncbi:hypothetical protein QSV34_03885 [Porticoccus sp. W117]|uniref:hypothetical protein n=1 Tax=Porticoccus sp. W117 TaxID=3054777 RepID=UPI002596CDD1|nr:hypothetical protein [Porticoccus sp. W117]MDM3870493.1 hypothetical protein [Porticoccus sp. W117]